MGFQALLVSVGAQGTKWLGLPGEELPRGVYHAKDLVYHYNKLPPFSQKTFTIGQRLALVGVGNVMLDIARWAIRTLKVKEVIAVARRGPAEVKFDKKEMEYVVANLDVQALDVELARCAPLMQAIDQDVQASRDYILSALPKALEPVSQTRFLFDFLASPTKILGDEEGLVRGLEVEDNELVPFHDTTKAKSLGTRRVIDVDTVIFCIGDRVDETYGLPVEWNEFVKNPNPLYPVDEISYEAYDPEAGQPVPGVFVAGWSREASSGLVGIARKDGERGAKAVLQYLEAQPPLEPDSSVSESLEQRLKALEKPVV
jgi:ferredoxin--NADP+ reductase